MVAADAAGLPFADGTFDLVVAFLSLQDIQDLTGAVAESARVLGPGGRLCAAIVHPFNSTGRFDGRTADSPFVVAGSYLTPGYYVDEVQRAGPSMRFASTHRPLQHYAHALATAGYLIEDLREPPLPEEAVGSASDRRWQRIPGFLHLRAVRG